MLKIILDNPLKYPLDAIVHYDMGELDFPFVKKNQAILKEFCKRHNIKYFSIKPRISYRELVDKYYLPTRVVRWCNSKFKLDCQKQLDEFLKSNNRFTVPYIGLCADETKRFKDNGSIYPLLIEGIFEKDILSWAVSRTDLFDDWYSYFNRQGCMFCPLASYKEFAYLYVHFHNEFLTWEEDVLRYEEHFKRPYFKEYFPDFKKKLINKYVPLILQNNIFAVDN